MNSHTHDHTHGAAVQLAAPAHGTLVRGLTQLLDMTEGLAFHPLVSEKHPRPLAHAAYADVPDPEVVRRELSQAIAADPVAALPKALALLELHECNQPDAEVCLHSLDVAPHTGCGCFRLTIFRRELPRFGIGATDAGYEGACPDGRRWEDLHYALAGKQTPGMAGAAPTYLLSARFLQAHGGWGNVVWVSPKIADIMDDRLPAGVAVG